MMDSFPEAVDCFCAHNIIVQMIPVYYGPGKESIFMDFCFTLNSLEAFTIIGRLFVNDMTSDTVSILFGFNKAFSPDRSLAG